MNVTTKRKMDLQKPDGSLSMDAVQEILAAGGVSADAERPEILAMLKHLSDHIDALEAKADAGEEGEGSGEEVQKYETWKPWDGISGKYQNGAIVYHDAIQSGQPYVHADVA